MAGSFGYQRETIDVSLKDGGIVATARGAQKPDAQTIIRRRRHFVPQPNRRRCRP